MKIFRILMIFLAVVTCGLVSPQRSVLADEKIRIVATTSVLANMAERIAGDQVRIYYIASPKRDLHKIAVTPRDVLKTKKADIFLHHGLQAEPWLLPLLNAAGKEEFLQGTAGRAIDASVGIVPLEVPEELNRLEGDVHPQGNPHYWLDPENGKVMANNIAKGLARLYAEQSALFFERAQAFEREVDERLGGWRQRMAPFRGAAVVTYHRSWSYFAEQFHLEVVGEIEPKPGIPPTSKHLNHLMNVMRDRQVRLVIKETYFEDRTPRKLARVVDAKVIELLQFSGERKKAGDYLSMMEYNISQIEQALAGGEA